MDRSTPYVVKSPATLSRISYSWNKLKTLLPMCMKLLAHLSSLRSNCPWLLRIQWDISVYSLYDIPFLIKEKHGVSLRTWRMDVWCQCCTMKKWLEAVHIQSLQRQASALYWPRRGLQQIHRRPSNLSLRNRKWDLFIHFNFWYERCINLIVQSKWMRHALIIRAVLKGLINPWF